jgi:hypothetical protein
MHDIQVVDDVEYVSPLQPFTGSSGEVELMEKWKEHYKRLGIGILLMPSLDGKAVVLLVNKEQNDKSWQMPCKVGDCHIDPPHPDFGEADYNHKAVKRMGKTERKYVRGEV